MSLLSLSLKRLTRSLAAVFTLILCSGACLAESSSLANLIAALPLVQAQLVFDGAQMADHQMTSYRLVTKLSPERLIADVEAHWSKNDMAKVWRSQTETWLMVSKVERFPEVEVLQVRRASSEGTIARLSIGSPSTGAQPNAASFLAQWLPESAKVLQNFSSTDPGRQGQLLIAKTSANLKESADWIEAQARRAGFKYEPRLKANSGSGQSIVSMLSRGNEEVIMTLDRMDHEVAIVLQHSRAAR